MGFFQTLKKQNKQTEMDMTMEILLCFSKNSLSIADILKLIEASKGFEPSFITKFRSWRDREELTSAIYNDLKNADHEASEILLADGIGLHDKENKDSVFFHTLPIKEKSLALYWCSNAVHFSESEIFNQLIAKDGFIAGYCYNKEDLYIQNSSFLHVYEEKKIKPIATIKNWLGQIEVDVNKNPGKRNLLSRTWIMSSWKMWFGKSFYPIVSKENLQQFKAYSIREIENEVTCIQLYEKPEDFETKESRQIQMAFKEWMNYKKLVEQFPEN